MSRRRLTVLAAGVTVVAAASTTAWAISGGDASQTAASAGLAGVRQSGDPTPGAVPDPSASQKPAAGNAEATANEIATPSTGPSATPDATAGPSTASENGTPETESTPRDAAAPKTGSTSRDSSAAKAERAAKSEKAGTPKTVSKPKVRVISAGTCGASFYDEGQMTASGERFNPRAMTAAHKSLAMGSRVRVTNPANGESVTVRINDRGPYVGGRCLDLSRAAFSAIGNTGAGVMRVKYEVLGT
ncbi:septal ring lytic transglycosylase RlpA family protein [Streptosporangium canum]|uniref:septal ring lytic transglycosylase RlpA family protein n=1 Tax=Streptosporangium canum TaxID=324952 RepID=UPI0037AC12C1